jgi:anti-sigma factor RsiW
MACHNIEILLPEYLEGLLSPAQGEMVAGHLTGCAECRGLAAQLRQLEAALSSCVAAPGFRPRLPADFDRHLRERIAAVAAPVILSEAQRAERRRQLQADFEVEVRRIRQGAFAWNHCLRHLKWPWLATMAAIVAWFGCSQWLERMGPGSQTLAGMAVNSVPWVLASAVFLGISLVEAWPRRLGRRMVVT